jgi:hypothetical protein
MLVVDASAVAELLLGRPPAAAVVARQLAAHAFDLHAPHLLDVEVLSVLRRLVASASMSARRGEEAIDDLYALPWRSAWRRRPDPAGRAARAGRDPAQIGVTCVALGPLGPASAS